MSGPPIGVPQRSHVGSCSVTPPSLWGPRKKELATSTKWAPEPGPRGPPAPSAFEADPRGRAVALHKSRDQVVAGVCGGLADEADMDPTLMRVLYVVLTIVTGVGPGLVAYIVLAIVMDAPPAPPD